MSPEEIDPIRRKMYLARKSHDRMEKVRAINHMMTALERGEARAAVRDEDGVWTVEEWVKEGIIEAFRAGILNDYPGGALSFIDKDTVPPRKLRKDEKIRVVPGGSAIRRGAFVGQGVVMMPPSYINVGAYVGKDTMVDSHVLVGSCAQIGERVHLSAGAQIGGVLEPIGMMPVIIEDDVIVGGNTGIYEGTIVRPKAVIGAGTVITASTPVYDAVRDQIYRATHEKPLEIPYGAVVVPGSRPFNSDFAKQHGLHIATPVIVKYRDEKTDAATLLEEALR